MKCARPTKVHQVLLNDLDLFCSAVLSQASKDNSVTAVFLLQTNAFTRLKQNNTFSCFSKPSARLPYCLIISPPFWSGLKYEQNNYFQFPLKILMTDKVLSSDLKITPPDGLWDPNIFFLWGLQLCTTNKRNPGLSLLSWYTFIRTLTWIHWQ